MADAVLTGLDLIVSGHSRLDMNRVVERRTNGADIKVGSVVSETGETFPDIDLAADTEGFLGIVWKHANEEDIPADWDIKDLANSTFADNTYVLVILPHGGDLIVQGHISPKAANGNDTVGNEHLVVSAETGGEGQLDTSALIAEDSVGKALSNQVITVGATDTMRVVYRY